MIALSHIASREPAPSGRGVFGWLFRARKPEPVSQHAQAISAARAKRDACVSEYREAKEVGDTRRMAEAHRSLRHATTDLVRLELGRS